MPTLIEDFFANPVSSLVTVKCFPWTFDAKIALIGGINIAHKYNGSEKVAPWLDYAVEINDENIAESLQKLSRDIYFKNRIIRRKEIKSVFETPQETTIKVLQNDWLKRKNEIFKTYFEKKK